MGTSVTTQKGTLKPDGSLELADRPPLPAGLVEVTIRPVRQPVNGENWSECPERIRARRGASGHQFRTKEEIVGEIEELRSGWDDKVDEAYRQVETERGIEGQV